MEKEKVVSAGIVIKRKSDGAFLQCHCTGRKKDTPHSFDIPKGQIEKSETPKDAMLRELWEETGIDWRSKNIDIKDLGRHKYTSGKDLYLFYAEIDDDEIDIDNLKCRSYFTDKWGRQMPEINGYQFSTDLSYYYQSLVNVMNDCCII